MGGYQPVIVCTSSGPRMRLSRYFLPVLKEAPADAQIVSHQLMLRAGMIKQNGAGIYSWLPLGMRVLHKIEKIVREEQERAGAGMAATLTPSSTRAFTCLGVASP